MVIVLKAMRPSTNRAVALLVAAYVALLWFDAGPLGNIHNGDTGNLVAGTRVALDCLNLSQWSDCGHLDGSIQTDVFPYPLLQYLPAAAFIKAGASDTYASELLARLNIVAFAASFGLAYVVLRRRAGMWSIACAALLGSALTYQATAGFGEMLSAATILGAVASAQSRRWWLITAAFALACISKETLPPFVLALGLVAGRDDEDGLLPCRSRLIPMVMGTVAGVGASLLFNVFRFGTPRNLLYLDPALQTPGLARKVEFMAAQWFAPSSGVVWYWPIAALVLSLCAVTALWRMWQRRPPREWLPMLALSGVTLAFTAGLSFWNTPFGWTAYGPRLAAPLLPAVTVLALASVRPPHWAPVMRRWLGHPAALIAAIAVVAFVTWPQLGAPWTYERSVRALIAEDGTCPSLTQFTIQEDQDRYFRCSSHIMWRIRPSTLAEAASLHEAPSTLARGVGIAIAALAAVQVRSRRMMRLESFKQAC